MLLSPTAGSSVGPAPAAGHQDTVWIVNIEYGEEIWSIKDGKLILKREGALTFSRCLVGSEKDMIIWQLRRLEVPGFHWILLGCSFDQNKMTWFIDYREGER